MKGYLTLKDVAERWGVRRNTLAVRRHRGNFPEPDAVIGREPVWLEATIEDMEDTTDGQMDHRS